MQRTINSGGTALALDDAGEGIPIVLAHGLTATRRYVVMGSKALERSGHRVLAFDARGHGRSACAPPGAGYGYDALCTDLIAILDHSGIERAVFAGASMGAHTILAAALSRPDRVAGIVAITPAFLPGARRDLDRWDRLADGLEERGTEGFLAAYDLTRAPEKWRETLETVIRQRLALHEHPRAVAAALREVPRSDPFVSLDALAMITVPTVIVASRDEADPGHPLAVGEAYRDAIPDATLLTEEPGASPLAWQGGRISRVIAELAQRCEGLASRVEA